MFFKIIWLQGMRFSSGFPIVKQKQWKCAKYAVLISTEITTPSWFFNVPVIADISCLNTGQMKNDLIFVGCLSQQSFRFSRKVFDKSVIFCKSTHRILQIEKCSQKKSFSRLFQEATPFYVVNIDRFVYIGWRWNSSFMLPVVFSIDEVLFCPVSINCHASADWRSPSRKANPAGKWLAIAERHLMSHQCLPFRI